MRPLTIRRRACAFDAAAWPASVHPVLARVLAARGADPAGYEPRLSGLIDPAALDGIGRAVDIVVDAIDHDRRICIVGDFDADGATATAVAVRGLRLLGARDVRYSVPNRARHGYGLSRELVETLLGDAPELIVTVDNGIASHAGVALARSRGIRVIVTDHHLPGATLPDADAIVNPVLARAAGARASESGHSTRHESAERLGSLAGVGVMFYLLLAVRARLRADGRYRNAADEPDLGTLLDLVALGTVADLVPLDANNRALVAAGLRRIRAGRASAGIAALCRDAGRDVERFVAADFAFALAPRINAAGRLDDMRVGIECLLTDDADYANAMAARLGAINAERRGLQAAMVEQAEAAVAEFASGRDGETLPHGVVLFRPDWHAGVVGLVASKLKERLHRPVVAFAPAQEGSDEVRGSARSIAGFHLRDALADVDARCPGLIPRFGGHAMAAGLTLRAADIERFAAAFDDAARTRLEGDPLEPVIWSDGELGADDFRIELAQVFRYAVPWGQAFPEPAFDNVFETVSWRVVGDKHLRLTVRPECSSAELDAMMFDAVEHTPPPDRMRAVYQLDIDNWTGVERLRLLIRHLQAE